MNQLGATASNRSTVPTTDSADQMIPTRSALTETVPPQPIPVQTGGCASSAQASADLAPAATDPGRSVVTLATSLILSIQLFSSTTLFI
jgi:hypothetical protein